MSTATAKNTDSMIREANDTLRMFQREHVTLKKHFDQFCNTLVKHFESAPDTGLPWFNVTYPGDPLTLQVRAYYGVYEIRFSVLNYGSRRVGQLDFVRIREHRAKLIDVVLFDLLGKIEDDHPFDDPTISGDITAPLLLKQWVIKSLTPT